MKKNLLIAAIAITALASCSSNDYVGDQSPQTSSGEGVISFDMNTPAMTRAGGSTAATALSNRFIVWGEKNETDGTAASAANLVFKNYKVEWTDNSAYTSTSNTKNWEYVGLTPYTEAQVSPSINPTVQTIKYWDYSASSYTFTAVSALDADITAGHVIITKNTSGSTVYDKGYDIAVKAGASLGNIYIADRNQPTKGTGTNRDADNTYGGNVKMTFRNFLSKIRFGIYENIPGYKVKITNVDYNSTYQSSGDGGTGKFGVDGKFLVPGDNTTYTVTYENSSNKAIMAVKGSTTPNNVTYLETAESIDGCPILHTTPTEISTSSATPTWDKTGGAYTNILPFPSNDISMKVKLDFTLYSEDTNEEIKVVDATAEIPAIYCQWKPNYAYTYILKLNDNTNGQIGGVTGLYPITFDAVEVTDENGSAEYITTVSAPSITTFGVSGGKYVTGGSEYAAGSDIYATFTEGSAVKTPVLGTSGESHVNVFSVTSADPTNFKITEASVAEAVANPARITNSVWTCAVTDVTEKTATELTNDGTYYKKDTNNKAPGDAGYIPTLAVKTTDYTIGATAADNTITDGVNIYTCTVTYTSVASAADLATGTTYYKSDGSSKTPGTTGYEPTIAVEGTDYRLAPKITATNITTSTSDTYFTGDTAPAVVNVVPGEDGVNKTIDAVKLTGVKAGTYAIEYEASAAWTGTYTKVYKVIVVQ